MAGSLEPRICSIVVRFPHCAESICIGRYATAPTLARITLLNWLYKQVTHRGSDSNPTIQDLAIDEVS